MGRIKTSLIKRLTYKLVKNNKDQCSTDFDKNKEIVSKSLDKEPSKKLKNTIAGYITRIMKKGDKMFIKLQ